jgi:hypothetical protein
VQPTDAAMADLRCFARYGTPPNDTWISWNLIAGADRDRIEIGQQMPGQGSAAVVADPLDLCGMNRFVLGEIPSGAKPSLADVLGTTSCTDDCHTHPSRGQTTLEGLTVPISRGMFVNADEDGNQAGGRQIPPGELAAALDGITTNDIVLDPESMARVQLTARMAAARAFELDDPITPAQAGFNADCTRDAP